jgi:hypothetical protein
MEKEFVPYEQALDLKELGFDEPCFKGYTEEYKTLISFSNTRTNSSVKNTLQTKPFTAPLFQQAFRWFREKYNINTVVECWNSEWKFTIQLINHCSNGNTEDCFLTYEEAELECLKKLIEIIKNKKKL